MPAFRHRVCEAVACKIDSRDHYRWNEIIRNNGLIAVVVVLGQKCKDLSPSKVGGVMK